MFARATNPASTRFNRFMRHAATVVAAFTIAACQPTGQSETASGPQIGQPINPSEPLVVALLAPGGSGSAELEGLATSLKNAARMAVADAQGATIDLRIYDTAANADQAVSQANEAVANGAKIILGPLLADNANAVGAAMRGKNVNVVSFSNNPQIAGGNVYVLGNTFQNVANRLVSYGVDQGLRRFLMVSENDVAGNIGAAAIEGAVARNGASLAGKTSHPVSQQGINSVVPQIAEAAKSNRADAIFLTANNGAVLPYLTEQLAAAGVTSDVAQIMGLTRWDEPADRLGMPQLQGGWFAIPDHRLQSQFESRYRNAYGSQPHALAGLGYDGVAALAGLLRDNRSDAVQTSGLKRSQGFVGVNGIFRFTAQGANERGLAVASIRENKLVVLDPAPRRFGGRRSVFGF